MVGLGDNSSGCNSSSKAKDKKKKKRGGSKRKMTAEQTLAFKSVTEWVYLDHQNSSSTPALSSWVVDDLGLQKSLRRGMEKVVFELHSHSKHSDGFLSPSKLVERAHGNGVSLDSYLFFSFFVINRYLIGALLFLSEYAIFFYFFFRVFE